MKTINAKRIAAVAASLFMGLAFAGQGVTFGNIPITNTQGQPVVQIVVGSTAWPSDGVVAANIAAVIGNLAVTTANVTATVSNTNKVSCVVTTPTCSISNAQVWLGEAGTSVPSSSFGFYTLIGSIVNQAIPLNAADSTKTLQGSGQYTFQELKSLTISPVASPYTIYGSVPQQSTPSPTSNGGGASFTTFTSGTTNGFDNILQVTNTQLPALASNWGANGENEFLWVSGFPVYDQASGVNSFKLLSGDIAYQITFNKPIFNKTTSGTLGINVPIKLLGQNYTILNESGGGTSSVGSANVVNGGHIKLAAALVPAQVLYVGKNITTGLWVVTLQDLGQAAAGGNSPASVALYYNGQLTNTTSIWPGNTVQFNYTGHNLYVNVMTTFAGLYAYQKWSKMQVYSNVINLTDGKVYNTTWDPGWRVNLLWTNTTSSSAANAIALQSIVVYNASATDLSPGSSIIVIQSPQTWKLTFVGDTLGTSGYDTLTASVSGQGSYSYQNKGSTATTISVTNVTEPAQFLTVTSGIPNAFSYAGQTSSQVQYLLNAYQLNEVQNSLTTGTGLSPNVVNVPAPAGTNIIFAYCGPGASTWVSSTNPLTITLTGFTSNTATSTTTASNTFTSPSGNGQISGTTFFNITNIQLSRALPGNVQVQVYANAINGLNTVNEVLLAELVNIGGIVGSANPGNTTIVYGPLSGKTYYSVQTSAAQTATYSSQNGQPTVTATLTGTPPTGVVNLPKPTDQEQYAWFAINSLAVSSNTNAKGAFAFGIVNSTAGVGANPVFNVNFTANMAANGNSLLGQNSRNATYVSSGDTTGGGTKMAIKVGFVGERGGGPTAIGQTSDTFRIAKVPDTLLFTVGPASSATSTSASTKNFGPYGVGQATNLANVTIANVTAKCTGGTSTSSSCTVTGLSNLTATPTVTSALTRVHLNTAVTPLAVLDSNANQASTLILVGSKYVNSVAGQVFAQNPSLNSSFGPGSVVVQAFGGNRILVAGYTANQTVTAGNQFIQALLAAASSAGIP